MLELSNNLESTQTTRRGARVTRIVPFVARRLSRVPNPQQEREISPDGSSNRFGSAPKSYAVPRIPCAASPRTHSPSGAKMSKTRAKKIKKIASTRFDQVTFGCHEYEPNEIPTSP